MLKFFCFLFVVAILIAFFWFRQLIQAIETESKKETEDAHKKYEQKTPSEDEKEFSLPPYVQKEFTNFH